MITDKRSGKPIVKARHIKRLAREIASVYFDGVHRSRSPLILLYGAGSFGHPLAHRYKLSGRALSPNVIVGMAKIVSAVHQLGGALTNIFLSEGIPVVPLQTSALVRQQKGKLVVTNYSLIEDILSHGGVPLLGGDVIIADRRHTVIVSADRLAAKFVRHFHSRKLLFATDVNGVYKKFPVQTRERPLNVISRKELKNILITQAVQNNALDVTGAMVGKLRALLSLRKCTVFIFNGLRRGVLTKVLHDGAQGTRIVL